MLDQHQLRALPQMAEVPAAIVVLRLPTEDVLQDKYRRITEIRANHRGVYV